MVCLRIKRTEEETKKDGWPCWMCVNSVKPADDRLERCGMCKKADVNSKPSEFYLRTYC